MGAFSLLMSLGPIPSAWRDPLSGAGQLQLITIPVDDLSHGLGSRTHLTSPSMHVVVRPVITQDTWRGLHIPVCLTLVSCKYCKSIALPPPFLSAHLSSLGKGGHTSLPFTPLMSRQGQLFTPFRSSSASQRPPPPPPAASSCPAAPRSCATAAPPTPSSGCAPSPPRQPG